MEIYDLLGFFNIYFIYLALWDLHCGMQAL